MRPEVSQKLLPKPTARVSRAQLRLPRRNVAVPLPTQPAQLRQAIQDSLVLDPIRDDWTQPTQAADDAQNPLLLDPIRSDWTEPSQDKNDTRNPLVFDPIESSSEEGVHFPLPDDDDPQVDWRTTQVECGPAELDDVNDNSTRSLQAQASYRVPDVVNAEATSHGAVLRSPGSVPIHEIYSKLLTELCEKTATRHLEAPVLQSLPFVAFEAKSVLLDREQRGESLLYAFALVVHVWQAVGLRVHHGSLPKQDESLSTQWTSYLLSAYSIVNSRIRSCRYDFSRFQFAVQHWESRLFEMGGQDVWNNAVWLRNIDGPIFRPPTSRNDIADEYLRVLATEGKIGLAAHVLEKELEGPVTPLRTHLDPNKPEEKRWAVSEIFGIFNGMKLETLKSLIDGSLSRESEVAYTEVWGDLQRIGRPEITRPSIYSNCICDAMGISPTPAQWKTVCEKMRYYTEPESNEFAAAIDQLIYPSNDWPTHLASKNLRRYTEWRSWLNNGDKYPNQSHRKMVRYFAGQMQERLANQPDHVPLSAPVIEIGFSIDSHDRLKQHARHRNSNYLMNLSEAVFEYCYPKCFRLQQQIIFNCYAKEQPWLSEIVLTQLGQGYTEGGGGFSHHPAGNSNGSAYRKTTPKEWDRYEAEAFEDGRMDAELDRENAWAERRDREKEEAFEVEKQRLLRFGDLLDSMRRLTEATRASGSKS